ncbi:MAG: hypothetical protein HY815_18050, partial [Candidatus Riflebacteria bacterium]|nr:hypothetical protein [Candidatus Riflebacteria bacterium]
MRTTSGLAVAMAWFLLAIGPGYAADVVIHDRDVVRVGLGPAGKLALVKHGSPSGPYSIEDEAGRRLVFDWDNPILDAGFLPDGTCAYLCWDKFW